MLIRMPFVGAELHDAREHRDGAVRRQARGVDSDLPQARQVALKQLHHLRQVVPRRRFAARDVEVLDRTPERTGHDRLELLEGHVRLAVAPFPVVAHRAARIADPGAVVDEHRWTDRVELRADERVDEVPRDARCRFCEVLQAEGVGGHSGCPPSLPRRAVNVRWQMGNGRCCGHICHFPPPVSIPKGLLTRPETPGGAGTRPRRS